jgi:hypothetical protein
MNLEIDKEKIHSLSTKKVTLGFDGFVDEIVKAIRSVDDKQQPIYFSSIPEFGNYILEKNEKNFAVELEEVITKIGGNMPITANALAGLGVHQSCIGTLGYPDIHSVFELMHPNCKLFSFANPGFTKAIEFKGSKILLAEMGDLNQVNWETIKRSIGIRTLTQLFIEPDLVCLLNWSEIKNSNAIWRGLLQDVLQKHQLGKRPLAFVDLADCSRKSSGSIHEAIGLLKDFSAHWDVVLGLNLNEAINVHSVVTGRELREKDIETIGEDLFKQMSVHSIVIHFSRHAWTWDHGGVYRASSNFISQPKISTGAGDNFNAGYCLGLLMALNTESCLALGHATSGYYMQHGRSPNMDEISTQLLLTK